MGRTEIEKRLRAALNGEVFMDTYHSHWQRVFSKYECIGFQVRGQPAARQSPRSFKNPKTGSIIVTRAPDKNSKGWMEDMQRAMEPHLPDELWDGAIALCVEMYFLRPKSIPKSRVFPTVKPDIDNCLKNIKDALKMKIITDDSRIISVNATKQYGDPPRTVIMVWNLDIIAEYDGKPHEPEVIEV